MIERPWSTWHISSKTLTYNRLTYRAIPGDHKLAKKSKAYFWDTRKSLDSERETKSKDVQMQWKIQGMSQVSGMLAVSSGSQD